MSALGKSQTSFNTTQGIGYATVDGGLFTLPQTKELWKPRIIAYPRSTAMPLPLGGIFLVVFATLCAVSIILLCITLFYPSPFLSVKFAIFLVLFFGAFAGELLFARKIKKDGH